MSQSSVDDLVEARREYSAGFVTDVETDTLPPGLNEDVIRFISERKDEPEWLTQWRLQAFQQWQDMTEPDWPHLHYPEVDFQSISYYSALKAKRMGPGRWTK